MKWHIGFKICVSIIMLTSSFVERPSKVFDAIKIIKDQSPSDHTEMKTFCKDPYGICKKKMPYGNDFQKIITRSLCKWKRTYFKAPTPMFDGEARYTNGKDSVFILFSLQRDSGSRDAVFKTIKAESIESTN